MQQPTSPGSALVEPSWLFDCMPNVTILDASWYMPSAKRDPNAEYMSSHIPGARRFDIDAPGLSDRTSSLPHMLPNAVDFASTVPALGLTASYPIVVYSTNQFVGAARAWWMLRYFGFSTVYVLNGGLTAWMAAGHSTDSSPPTLPPSASTSLISGLPKSHLLRTLPQMRDQIAAGDGIIIDARSDGRFYGTAAEPRPGLRSGHMPGALNVPSSLLTEGSGRLKSPTELRAIFEKQGLDFNSFPAGPISLTCGSGVTAAIVSLALHELGIESAVYDGSWSEYGSLDDVAVVVD